MIPVTTADRLIGIGAEIRTGPKKLFQLNCCSSLSRAALKGDEEKLRGAADDAALSPDSRRLGRRGDPLPLRQLRGRRPARVLLQPQPLHLQRHPRLLPPGHAAPGMSDVDHDDDDGICLFLFSMLSSRTRTRAVPHAAANVRWIFALQACIILQSSFTVPRPFSPYVFNPQK